MSERWAVINGNSDDPSVWNGGTLPGAGDDVFANGFTVTITASVQWLSAQTLAGSTAVAGGGFVLNDGVTLAATVKAGTTTCVTYNGVVSATILGDSIGGDVAGSLNTSTGQLTVTGFAIGSAAGFGAGVSGVGTTPVRIRGAKHGANGCGPFNGKVVFIDSLKATIEVRNTSLGAKTLTAGVPAFAGFPLSRVVQ